MEVEILNTKNLIKTHCPSCGKKYHINSDEILSHNPHFSCRVCHASFSFIYQEGCISDLKLVKRSVLDSEALLKAEELENPHFKKCPKCGLMNTKFTQECGYCSVLVSRVENISMDKKVGALPSLVTAWQDLIADYSSLEKHLAFAQRCDDLNALPFALKKYQDMKEAQPQDQLTQDMHKRILMLQHKEKKETTSIAPSSPIHRLRKLAPVLIPLLFIVLGIAKHSIRNLVGLGVAVLFVYLGLTFIKKGRLSLSDFW